MQKVWFRKQIGWWFVTLNEGGQQKQYKLVKAPDTREGKDLAEERLIELLASKKDNKGIEFTDKANLTVAQVVLAFQIHSKKNHQAETARWYSDLTKPFSKMFGKLLVSELRKKHVHAWIEAKKYNPTSANRAIGAIKRVFNWAVEEEHISKNPIAHVRKPKGLTRDRTLTPEERQLILTSIKDDAFRQFVQALTLTGCRPSEVARVTAADVNLNLGVWVLGQHKTKHKTGKPRIVYLCPEAMELTQDLVQRRPSGPLFLNLQFLPWKRNAIRVRFRRLRKKYPQLKDVISYTYRHSFATDALENGIPDTTVAALMGHADTSTLHRFYNKLSTRVDHLKDAANQAIRNPKADVKDEPPREAA